jgi:hypothetical protein
MRSIKNLRTTGRKQKDRKRGRYAEKKLKGQKAAIKRGKNISLYWRGYKSNEGEGVTSQTGKTVTPCFVLYVMQLPHDIHAGK